jgi:hypothetical protein
MKRRKAFQWVALAGAVGMLAGCGDERVANTRNLEHALNRDYSVNADCLFDKPLPFPYEISVSDPLLSETRHRLDALVEAGLLTREQRPQGQEIINHYSMTVSGSQVKGHGRFCYGSRQVTSIEKITPPVDYQGMPLTKVEYHFVLKDGASWARQTEVREAFPNVAKSLQQEPVDDATLVLTQNGWELTY